MSKSQSRIPRADSKIPTFGFKAPSKLPASVARQSTTKLPASGLRVPQSISRSSSGAELRQRSNLVKNTNFSSSSNVVGECGFFRVSDDQHELLVNETIDLVKGSSDSLEVAASSGGGSNKNNETYCATVGDATFVKPSNLVVVAPGPVDDGDGIMNETVTVVKQQQQQHQALNDTFEVQKKSRLSTDLAEKMNGTIALNSTMKCEKLLDVTTDVPKPCLNLSELPNATQLLCMTYEGENISDKTLVPDEIQDHLPPSSDDDGNEEEDVEMIPVVMKSQEGRIQLPPKQRFSFGLDLTECTLDCSIELCDVSNSSSMQHNKSPSTNTKQSSFDESLGILTPDQMKEFLDSTKTSTGSHLQLFLHNHKGVGHHHCRIDLTPSPEELPLDPVEVKTDEGEIVYGPETIELLYQEPSQAESDPKTDLLTKSTNSKISNSFITSITSVTSLDTGYQGDGETSRPASRGADTAPRAGSSQANWAGAGVVQRRQDPMTDSDFFTESDADDLIHRGDRRAQIIDGQLFGSSLQGADVPPIVEPNGMEDSCMESSGIFTDADTRADDDGSKNEPTDLSPDTETQSSNKTTCSQRKVTGSTTVADNNTMNETTLAVVAPVTDDYVDEKMRETVALTHTTAQYSRTAVRSANEELNDDDDDVVVGGVVGKSSKAIDNVRQCDGSTKARNSNGLASLNSAAATVSAKKTDNLTRKQNARRHDLTPQSALFEKRCKIRKTSEDENEPRKIQRKSANPNKWDAVMNKIAENKSNQAVKKKNFSDVKSKVFSGLSAHKNYSGSSRAASSTSAVSAASSSSTISSTIKRQLFSTSAKRASTLDSEHSSHSDYSYRSGSPKALSKISSVTRSSKKRDVRLISHQDDTSLKEKVSSVKSGNSPQLKELKNSPPSKKYLSSNGKCDDIGSNRSSPTQTKLGRSGCPTTTPTKHIGTTLATQQQKTSGGVAPGGTKIQQQQQQQKVNQNGHPLTQRNGTIILESATVTKKKSPVCERTKNAAVVNHNNNINGTYVVPKTAPTPAVVSDKKHQQLLLHHQQHEQGLQKELVHANKAVEAFGTMIQYLVFNLDAFSCPAVKLAHTNTKKSLVDISRHLDDREKICKTLELQLNEQKIYFAAKEEELKASQTQEISRVSSHYEDLTINKDNQIKNLEALLHAKDLELKQKIFHMNSDATEKISSLEKQLQESLLRESALDQRVQELTTKEYTLLEKAHASEIEFSEKIRALTLQLEKLKIEATTKQSELEEQFNLARDELSVVRQQQQRCTSVSPNKTGDVCRTQILQDEIESLRCVLDMRQREITDLRKHNQALKISADDRAAAMLKISSLESRVEDLQVQLQQRTEEDQRNIEKLKKLDELYTQEVKNKSRLSMHNEELQYRLKQNSERFSIALSELSRSFHDQTMYSGRELNLSHDPTHYSSSVGDNLNVSPPASPVVKGVVEKSDSVSYILEMENETPEVLASRFVRRAGSFRSGNSSYEKTSHSPVPKRQRCGLQLSASTTSVQLRRNNSDRSPQNQAQSLRVRSKSVTIKTADQKKFLAKKNSFQEPLCTSSPIPRNHHENPQLVEEFEDLDDQVVLFHRDTSPSFKASRGLITCDTSNLTGAELKKLRKPKLAAGEALISGSTSEEEEDEDDDDDEDDSDEHSTPDSPESPHRHHDAPREIPSLEDALMQKVYATFSRGDRSPREEISWSEGEPEESVV